MTRISWRTTAILRCLLPLAALLLIVPGTARADWLLWDWSTNINGTTYDMSTPYSGVQTLPPSINSTGFDFSTGLGSLIFDFSTPGPQYAGIYIYTFYDHGDGVDYSGAYGSVAGTPPVGLSWEMDWPGYLRPTAPPTVFDDFAANALTNSNGVGAYSPPPAACCSVALAAIQAFTLNAGDSAALTFTMGTAAPASGFYLQVTDQDAATSVYLTSSLVITPAGTTTLPEPSAVLLLATVCGGVLWRCRRRKP